MALINTTTTGVLGSTFYGDGSGDLTIQQNGVLVNKITSNGLTYRGTGSVLQVVSATLNTIGSTGSTTYVAVSGLSVAITPASVSNKVLIRGYIWLAGAGQNGLFAAVFRGGSILSGVAGSASQSNAITNGTGGTVIASGGFIPYSAAVKYQATPICFEFLDSPSSTSSLTYQVYVRVGNGATLYYNYQGETSTNADFGYFASTITAQEIAG